MGVADSRRPSRARWAGIIFSHPSSTFARVSAARPPVRRDAITRAAAYRKNLIQVPIVGADQLPSIEGPSTTDPARGEAARM